MAINTYATLQTAVASWLHRSDLTTYIPDFIMLGETRIYREVKTADMEDDLTGTVSAGLMLKPTDYIDLKYAYIDGSPRTWLDHRSAQWIVKNYTSDDTDTPKYIAVQGANFIFGPAGSGSLIGIYYKNLGAVSASAHALFTNNPDLYLFAALCEAEPFLKNDARVALWKAKYNEIRDQIIGTYNREDGSGTHLRMTLG